MVRDTLIDFFHDLSRARGKFLVYDDGFRSHSHTYADVARAARRFAARLYHQGLRQGDKAIFSWEDLTGDRVRGIKLVCGAACSRRASALRTSGPH